MSRNKLTTTNQSTKLTLSKSKSLLNIANKLLSKKDIGKLIESFKFKPFIKREKGHSSSISSVAISPDGKTIVSGSWDKTIKIWDMQSGEYLHTLEGHMDSVYSIAISPDGNRMVSGSSDETIKIWDMQSGEYLNTLEGHSSYVESVVISPDGKTIVSGDHNGTIKIWDMKNTKCLNTLKLHSGYVRSVAISLNGKTIVSVSDDEIIRIWDIQSGECVYASDHRAKVSIDKDGYFAGEIIDIMKYVRVSESPLSQRKLTNEEIKNFRKKGNFLEVGENGLL